MSPVGLLQGRMVGTPSEFQVALSSHQLPQNISAGIFPFATSDSSNQPILYSTLSQTRRKEITLISILFIQ